MDLLNEEPEIQAALEHLVDLLGEHDTIKEFQEIQQRALQNEQLNDLEEQIKQVQKAAVQFAHYDKPEAEKQANAEIDRLKKEYETHPLVIRYREKILDANDLLHYITENFEKRVNDAIEEEETNASKD
ncbi:YlbF family regulator [Tetragenococcus koreensis]|uniref:YlbF family regulator n=1 Tax=Tetragenococcus koreensis TaxID=290335 RepID=A0AAN4UCZ5_9ENTE|nr:YlbF family regulator [Tetragenococcus koreensis]AYW45809.1 hypothetical protein C7K43_07515 [Tetragenococcus koreensis]MCF1585390.1 YlbF family regulator [Tetragenococcus koreensis]MCF1614909.1 YlbF family regulator [Tetragenococcus koreensis]MCF1616650.1 YlbF family regulator [Tetragenococcus koreensis]MCF1619110.1 YlbF family regulator [Tetragenococcus koreensis]